VKAMRMTEQVALAFCTGLALIVAAVLFGFAMGARF